MNTIPLRAGFGRTEITPRLGVRLGGYGIKDRPAEAINDPLHATALVLAQGDLRAAILNLDWICVEEAVVERLRAEIGRRSAIPPAHVTVSTTHTHSAPNTLSMWGWGESEDGYIDAVFPAIVRAVELACAALAEVEVGLATTRSEAGVCRRSIDERGGVGFAASPQDPFDATMTVLRFRDPAGADTGVLVHYGAHNTAMGPSRIVSRDWCGVMKDRIEAQFKVPVLFLNGAIGDVGPRTNVRIPGGLSAGTGDGLDAVREVGYRAATDAIGALLGMREWRAGLPLGVQVQDIRLPYAPLLPLAEAQQRLAALAPERDVWGGKMCEYRYASAVIAAHAQPPQTGRDFRQVVTALGPLAIVPIPGELFSGIALRLRRDSPFPYTLCCSATNGSLGYLPTREAAARGGYEVWARRGYGAYLFADTLDDALVAENLRVLRQAWPAR